MRIIGKILKIFGTHQAWASAIGVKRQTVTAMCRMGYVSLRQLEPTERAINGRYSVKQMLSDRQLAPITKKVIK
jgi:hypothetical protein